MIPQSKKKGTAEKIIIRAYQIFEFASMPFSADNHFPTLFSYIHFYKGNIYFLYI